ncbi:hypothetical protein [Saccharopolyspora sp. 5N708]|uniref:hypothetical protein n=1 Tax=Saccharopolyspora sp. 5N708 TaxID=3457424 RepID=UPI003FD66120
MAVEHLLRHLASPGFVELDSSQPLVDKVTKEAHRRSIKFPAYRFRKNPRIVPADLPEALSVTPVEVLRQVGVATTFYGDSPFTAIAHHWAQLRYCATLETKKGKLSLSSLGDEVVHHHKVAQSEYLGIGLALVIAQETLRKQHPGWEFSPVDADFALDRGIPGIGSATQVAGLQSRPDYFLIGRRIRGGGGLKIVVLECKGTHSPGETKIIGQLAKACTQVRSVEIEGQNLSSLMVASRFLPSGIKVCVLDPPGESELWSGTDDELDEMLSEEVDGPPEPFSTRTPTSDDLLAIEPDQPIEDEEFGASENYSELAEQDLEIPQVVSIPQASRRWFSRVLARTFAASVLAFAGDGETAAKYRTPRLYEDSQGQYGLPLEDAAEIKTSRRFPLPGGLSAQGTQYSMPLPDGRRLDVFRGIEESVYEELGQERLGSYFRSAQRVWNKWSQIAGNGASNGRPVAFGRDGTVVTLEINNRRS